MPSSKRKVKSYHRQLTMPAGRVVSVNLPLDLDKALSAVARAHQLSKSDYVRHVLPAIPEIRAQLELNSRLAMPEEDHRST
jgi:hypothetical protein